jgi:GntR family transcriptional regulator
MSAIINESLLGQSRYGKLATAIKERILRGEWRPGQMLPSESALCQEYGVALGTIRQAMSLLVQDGIVQRQQGKGTFVTRGLDGPSMLRFFRFNPTDDEVISPQSNILQTRLRESSAQEALMFAQPSKYKVLQFERLRLINDEPCLLESIVVPIPLFGPLLDLGLHEWDDLLYPMYQKKCGVIVNHAQDSLSFSHLNLTQARRLKLTSGHPCVVVERKAYVISNRCIEMRTTRGDAYSFTYTAYVK